MTTRRRNSPLNLLLTCEHAGNRIPSRYRPLFDGADQDLVSHRGWDPGALPLARLMAQRLQRPLLATHWSRLLVEANRSPTNHRIWSRFTRNLPMEERREILRRYWLPHRAAVTESIGAAIRRGETVLHVAVHSFTPVLEGETRNADIAILFDSRRPPEAEFSRRWLELMRQRDPGLRLRQNYPYRGTADGLPTWLRRHYPPSRYLGFELEVNQALLTASDRRLVAETLAASLADALRRRVTVKR